MSIGRRFLYLSLLVAIGARSAEAQPANLVKDIRSGSASSVPSPVVVMGGIGYFAASDGISGRELWRTDGTTAGTYQVADIQPGLASSSPTSLVAAGDVLWRRTKAGLHMSPTQRDEFADWFAGSRAVAG